MINQSQPGTSSCQGSPLYQTLNNKYLYNHIHDCLTFTLKARTCLVHHCELTWVRSVWKFHLDTINSILFKSFFTRHFNVELRYLRINIRLVCRLHPPSFFHPHLVQENTSKKQ